MTFHGQSVLSCVWGVTHAVAPEPPAASAEISQRSGPRSPARLRVLSLVVRKIRPSGAGGEVGPSSTR
ncbi:MAG TPA: hypothetical protein VMH05_22640 [Bryobacteraceae bacterium]|nr:hypothetical protein [Bryobacteraceae bacterium]